MREINLVNLGIIPGLIEKLGEEFALTTFKKICYTRYFEKEVIKCVNEGKINCPVYLSIGQESISAAVSSVFKPDYLFAQHRAHSVYLSFGGNPVKLIDELLGKESGCSYGRGGSPSIQEDGIGMVGHHGLIGENIPIGVGAALGDPGKRVVCFFGDAAAEEDYVFSSIAFASTHKLPILFVCEDNDLSILTEKKVRRNWEMTKVLKAIGVPTVDITDDPWLIAYYVEKFKDNLPAYINCRTVRHHWHVGVGVDNKPEWDRFDLIKQTLSNMGLKSEADKIEENIKWEVEKIWKERSQKQ